MARRTAPPRPPAAPPATVAEGAAQARAFMLKLFARTDGEAVNWRLMTESLLIAGFEMLDKLPDEVCRSVATRIHEGCYNRMVNGPKTDSATSNSVGQNAELSPANTALLKSSCPKPPNGAI